MKSVRHDDSIKKIYAMRYLTTDSSAKDLAKEINVSPTTIYNWVKKFKETTYYSKLDLCDEEYKKIYSVQIYIE